MLDINKFFSRVFWLSTLFSEESGDLRHKLFIVAIKDLQFVFFFAHVNVAMVLGAELELWFDVFPYRKTLLSKFLKFKPFLLHFIWNFTRFLHKSLLFDDISHVRLRFIKNELLGNWRVQKAVIQMKASLYVDGHVTHKGATIYFFLGAYTNHHATNHHSHSSFLRSN